MFFKLFIDNEILEKADEERSDIIARYMKVSFYCWFSSEKLYYCKIFLIFF